MKKEEIIISLKNVGVSYPKRNGIFKRSVYWALKDISFDLLKCETLGIIGRNGVGKSTLLRVIGKIISPDKGYIEIVNKDSKISLLSLQAGFAGYLTGRENTILSGMLLGFSKRRVKECMDDIIEFSELDEFIDQPVNTYSTGMRTRLGFSVAYYTAPDVLLLDEVIGVGDAEFRKKSTDAMKERIKSNKTVVMASHSIPILREVCNRILWIENGIIQEIGSTDKVLEHYINKKK